MFYLATDPTPVQQSFFDVKTLGSLAGASLAVTLVCNAGQQVFNFNPKWLALLFSIIYSYTLMVVTGDYATINWLLAFLNGLLIWSTSVGTNAAIKSGPGGGTGFTSNAGRNRRFFDPWF
jgi:hypothetical protein